MDIQLEKVIEENFWRFLNNEMNFLNFAFYLKSKKLDVQEIIIEKFLDTVMQIQLNFLKEKISVNDELTFSTDFNEITQACSVYCSLAKEKIELFIKFLDSLP